MVGGILEVDEGGVVTGVLEEGQTAAHSDFHPPLALRVGRDGAERNRRGSFGIERFSLDRLGSDERLGLDGRHGDGLRWGDRRGGDGGGDRLGRRGDRNQVLVLDPPVGVVG